MKFSTTFIKANDALCDFDNHVPAPYFRKSFDLHFQPEKAEITICGLGFYELYINGQNVTKGPLAPYISNTDDICYYDNYDISSLLNQGENVIAILLGNGFRNGFGGFIWDFETAHCRGPVTAALCLEASNSEQSFKLEADETFKTHPSPITFHDLRMGCRYDARLEVPHWNEVGFDDSSWENARIEQTPMGEKKLCTADPIVVTDKIAPVKITYYDRLPFAYENTAPDAKPKESTYRDNVHVYDFGVNTAGITQLKINGRPGQKITIRHAEHLVGGKFAVNTTIFDRPESVNQYLEYGQTDEFICKGGEEIFTPKFKYDGFRYAYVEGLDKEQATADSLTLLVMNSDLKSRAGFSCSDPVINKLQECTRRSDLANFYYFPTDCPHREKNGWTGDASMSSEHMLLNLTAEKSLKEWLANIRAAQDQKGALPGIVPTGGWGFAWGNGPAWDSVCVNLPYFIYRFTGDTSVIEENAGTIMRYLYYITTRRDEKGLVAVGLGDWIDPNERIVGHIASPLIFTDSTMVHDIASKAAFLFRKIGKINEAAYAQAVADDMKKAIRKELIDWNTMTVIGDCQTSQAFAIETGIFSEEELPIARKRLVEIIHRDGDVNACGMIGLRYIFHALTNAGEGELAYRMITSKTRTGYGYWIEHGATALWENFPTYDSKEVNSNNHHFLGDISSWFIQELAGLKPNPHLDDITSFEISPDFIPELSYAESYFDSCVGRISTRWERQGDEITLSASVPANAHGTILLKNGYTFKDGTTEKVLEAGQAQNINLTVTK